MGNNRTNIRIGSYTGQFDEEGNLWLVDYRFGGLYKCNYEEKQLQLEHLFGGVKKPKVGLHDKIIINDQDIFIFPYLDEYIYVYNYLTNKEEKIKLPSSNYIKKTIKLKGKIWIQVDDVIYKFDVTNKSVKIDEGLTKIYRDIDKKRDCKTRIEAYEELTFYNEETRELYRIDCFNDKVVQRIKIINITQKVLTVLYMEDRYWVLLADSHDIYTIDPISKDILRYCACNGEYIDRKTSVPYEKIICINGEFLLPNYYGKYVMRINREKKTIDKVFNEDFTLELANYMAFGPCYTEIIKYEDYIFFIPLRGKYIVKCDDNYNIVEKISMCVQVNDELIAYIFGGAINNNCTITENDELSLKEMIEYLDMVK